MQIANQEVMYPATELVCFSMGKNGKLRYDGLMKTANVTESTYSREIKELTGEEYFALEKSNMPDKKDVLHTAHMLEFSGLKFQLAYEMRRIHKWDDIWEHM